MGDPFELMGVPRRFGIDPASLAQRHRDLSRALHPDRFVRASPSERRAAIERAMAVNAAFRTLRDPLARAEALLASHGVSLDDTARPDPALLLEVMELRESLEAAHGAPERIAALRSEVDRNVQREESVLRASLDDGAPDATALARARDAVIRLKYFRRFSEEADASSD